MARVETGSVGRRRLRILLGVLGVLGSAGTMGLILWFYGPPYNPTWWWAMAGALVASFFLPWLLVPAIEWVQDGYRQDRGA